MAVFAEYFAYAVAYRTPYMREVAVTYVEHELLQRASELYPRVAVGVRAVHLLLEVDVLYHVRRVLQSALQFEALMVNSRRSRRGMVCSEPV